MSDELKRAKPIDPMQFDKDSPYAEKKPTPKQAMVFTVPTKSPEDKIYLVLVRTDDQNDTTFDGYYKICEGRTETYRYIEHLVDSFGPDLNVYDSRVITETKQTETETGNEKYFMINASESISIYAFCKAVEGYYGDQGFKIDDHYAPPTDDIEQIGNLEREASLYGAQVADPFMAQIAMETYKEKVAMGNIIPHQNDSSVNV